MKDRYAEGFRDGVLSMQGKFAPVKCRECDHKKTQLAIYKPLTQPPRKIYVVKREYVLRALEYYRWNRVWTAQALGLSLRTLRSWLACYKKQGFVTTALEKKKAQTGFTPPEPSLNVSEDPSKPWADANREEVKSEEKER